MLHCVPKFEPNAEIGQKGAFCKGLTVFTARRYYRSFVKKGIDQDRRENLNGGWLIRSFCVTTDHITAIAAKLENIETVKL
jgi:hypothetical protein